MKKALELAGQKFGRLKAIRRADKKFGYWRWECLCDCGMYHTTAATNLTQGKVKSCGCLYMESRGRVGTISTVKNHHVRVRRSRITRKNNERVLAMLERTGL
jgi:hypothetical protein